MAKTENYRNLKMGLLLFFYVVIYNYAIINQFEFWKIDNITYTYHLVDYSFGFATKLLPGAIYHVFFKDVDPKQLTAYLTVLLLLIFFAAALIVSKVFTKTADTENQKAVLILLLFFFSGPCTFSIFSFELGMLDSYWLLLSIMFIAFLHQKQLRYFLPILFLLSLLVHFSSILAYIPFFFFLLLYETQKAEKKEKRILAAITIISAAVVIAAFLYFLLNEEKNLVYSLTEFNQQLADRNRFGEEPYYTYYDYSLYKEYHDKGVSFSDAQAFAQAFVSRLPFPSFLENVLCSIVQLVYQQVLLNFFLLQNYSYLFLAIPVLLVLTMPLLIMFYSCWIRKIKESNSFWKKALYFIPILLFPVTIIGGCLNSCDTARWFTHAFLIQFALYLFVLFQEDEIRRIRMNRIQFFEIAVYFMFYATVFFKPYK